jgi:oligopeptide transport system substrate-binding protein
MGAPSPTSAAGPPLRYAAGPPGSLDPAFIADQADIQLILQLYAGLTRLDEHGDPYPSLADGWTVSDDGLTYTFHVRDGLRFSDGSSLDAEDIRRSWLRLLDPETGATAPDVLGVVEGANARLAGEGDEADVGVEAPDPETLVVRLRHPASFFPEITAHPATFAVPPNAGASDSWQRPNAFVGSGPYAVDGTDGADLVLRANEHYVAGPPPIDEVRWVAGLESDGVSAFAAGDLDLLPVAGWDATWLAYDPELGRRLHLGAALSVGYLGFDATEPPFDDARVRRAFALALDRERLVTLSAGGASEPAGSLVPPAIWPAETFGDLRSDPDEARRLLADAEGDGLDISRVTVNGSGVDVAPIAATWREELGVEVAVEVMDFDAYFAAIDEDAPDVFSVNWIADYPAPDALYSLLLLPGALSNFGGWSDDRFVELLEDAARTTDEADRAAAYAAVDAYVAEQAPVVPWSYDESWWLVADGLRGLGNLTLGLMDFGLVSWDG